MIVTRKCTFKSENFWNTARMFNFTCLKSDVIDANLDCKATTTDVECVA